MVDPRIYCSNCSRCKTSNTMGCTTLGFKGISGTGGGFSESIAVDARLCYALPDNVDLQTAALIEPLAVAWHAITLCDIDDWSKKSVLILGGGPIGIACAISLRARGSKQVYISEPTATRAAQNKQLADAVINPTNEDVASRCRGLTGSEGVDVIFDCAGVQRGFDAGMDALKFRGLYMNMAVWTSPVSKSYNTSRTLADNLQMAIPFFHYFMKEITLKCAFAYNDKDFKETVDAFVAGQYLASCSPPTNLCDRQVPRNRNHGHEPHPPRQHRYARLPRTNPPQRQPHQNHGHTQQIGTVTSPYF